MRDRRKLEAQLADLRGRRGHLAAIPCPYRGLEVFDVPHAANYFGRAAMVSKLLAKLAETNFVVVVGPSGCGKSSLVRAGMGPALRNGALPRSGDWRVEYFKPGSQPLATLSVPLAAWLEPDLDRIDRLASAKKLSEHLASGALDLPFVVSNFANPAPRDDALLGKHADRGWGNVLPMSEGELRAAVEQPLRQAGGGFEDGLVQRILTDVAAAPGQLPLLEFALTQLWAQQRADGVLTNAAYDAIGGVSQAIAVHAEEVFAALSAEEQAQVPELFSNLVRVARPDKGGEDTRRRVLLRDLAPALHPLARRLAAADARLLVTDQDPATRPPTVEVVHEALIRQWSRLRGRLDADRAYLLWRDRYRADLEPWQAGHDAGALLRGGPLAEAERWREQHPQGWNDGELAYLAACLAQRNAEEERERRQVAELQTAQRSLQNALRLARS